MHPLRLMSLAAAGLAAVFALPARAAESYDNCTGYIDAIPASVSTQGTWCLRHDVSTAATSGAAVTVLSNNITIDCNGFKIGGLAAGPGSVADGILADGRVNTTVRNCGIRGFYRGVAMQSGSGHLVENNRFDQNLRYAILITGEDNLVRGNRVYDTGGATGSTSTRAISAWADVIDNIVSGVYAHGANGIVYGISVMGDGALTRGNVVRGVVSNGEYGYPIGLTILGDGHRLEDNHLFGVGALPGSLGFSVGGVPHATCVGNSVQGFQTGMTAGCFAGGDNIIN